MLTIAGVQGVEVRSGTGKLLGRVAQVLFHPAEPRVIGFEVERLRLFGVVRRKPRYVPLAMLEVRDGVFALGEKALPADKAGERVLGTSWDVTVRWRGMPVVDAEGRTVGAVADAAFGRGGALEWLRLSGGIATDLAVGKANVAAEHVRGFNGEAVALAVTATELTTDGGAAKVAAKASTAAAAAVKEHGGKAARAAGDATVRAAGALGRSIHSGTARRMLDGLRKAMGDDTDEGT